jgi:hypothetical protein
VKAEDRNRLKEAQNAAEEIIGDKRYRDNLKVRAIAGILPPAVEKMLWEYRFGKPVDKLDVNLSSNELRQMDESQLVAEFENEIAELKSLVKAGSVAAEATKLAEESREPEPEQTHFADLLAISATKGKPH